MRSGGRRRGTPRRPGGRVGGGRPGGGGGQVGFYKTWGVLPPAYVQRHHKLTWCARRSPSAVNVSSRELGCRRPLNCVGIAKPVWDSLDGNPGRRPETRSGAELEYLLAQPPARHSFACLSRAKDGESSLCAKHASPLGACRMILEGGLQLLVCVQCTAGKNAPPPLCSSQPPPAICDRPRFPLLRAR